MVGAAEEGDVKRLKLLIKKGILDPLGAKAQLAVLAAGQKNKVEALDTLVDWGVPLLSAKDLNGQKVFHLAAAAGAELTVKYLLHHGVEVGDIDAYTGKNAMQLALKANQLEVVRELLRAGADIPLDADAPGLAALVREMRLENMAAALRESAKLSVDQGELVRADDAVWAAMREHMRLLRIREEIQAGELLVSIERRTLSEKEVADRSLASEEALSADVGQNRVKLQTEQALVRELNRELDALRTTEMALYEMDAKLRKEMEERRSELMQATQLRDASEKAKMEQQETCDEALAESQALASKITEATSRKAGLVADLEVAQKELRGWLRDKEVAARLTAQAHNILGHWGSN